ncbi:hypothetical protein [Luteimonas salinilitoris]|uniref:hypothetical protein n=1 Tax=Luteimonas salinilitoris TaxID=3237697 RepID=UPI00351CAE30
MDHSLQRTQPVRFGACQRVGILPCGDPGQAVGQVALRVPAEWATFHAVDRGVGVAATSQSHREYDEAAWWTVLSARSNRSNDFGGIRMPPPITTQA